MSNLNLDEVMAAAEDQMFDLSNPGFCIKCGAYHDGCEPDAAKYPCEECGEKAVYGAQEILLRGLV